MNLVEIGIGFFFGVVTTLGIGLVAVAYAVGRAYLLGRKDERISRFLKDSEAREL